MKFCLRLGVYLLLSLVCFVKTGTAHNPCCSFPCQNGGVCMDQADQTYECDCSNTGYSGKNCRRADWSTWLINLIRPSPEMTHNIVATNTILWKFFNNIYALRSLLMRIVLKARTDIIDSPPILSADGAYPTVEAAKNLTHYARTLGPVPSDCPTPMGLFGPTQLPSAEEVAKRLFLRKKFIPNSLRTNTLFATYAQHFTHMFLKTDNSRGPAYTWGDQNVFMSHIYGKDVETENKLRSFVGGKMKMQTINGEEYPPYAETSHFPGKPSFVKTPAGKKPFVIGHPAFNMLPNLLFLTTIFLREHNRVVGILASVHPHWDDERLFQTAKLITLGETLKITIEDYVQHLSNYHFRMLFDPRIMYNERMQFSNRIHYEFNLLYHWHPLMPDALRLNDTVTPIRQLLFNPWPLVEIGTREFAKNLVENQAGEIGPHNHGLETLPVAIGLLKQSRQLRLQSFNQYRRRFRLKPYTSFLQITGGNKELAADLKDLYKHIDAIELYPGLIAEHRRSRSMFGETMIEMGSPYSLQGLYGNFFASPHLWRPSTFGGETGFRIINEATLKKLICNNVPPPCPHVSFKTHGENHEPITNLVPSPSDDSKRTLQPDVKPDKEL